MVFVCLEGYASGEPSYTTCPDANAGDASPVQVDHDCITIKVEPPASKGKDGYSWRVVLVTIP